MKIYIGNINEYSVDQLIPLVSGERVLTSMKYRFEADRKRSLLAHALLNRAICEAYPDITTPVDPVVDRYGKPHIYTGSSEVYFSLSHSGDHAVCAINDSPVGIDIEFIGDEKDQIARRFFSRSDLEYINDAESFYRIWTLKESFMKVTGLGMRLPMDRFSVADMNPDKGTCRFILNPDQARDPDDTEVNAGLKQFLKADSCDFEICGRFMTYENKYSLAYAYECSAADADYSSPTELISYGVD